MFKFFSELGLVLFSPEATRHTTRINFVVDARTIYNQLIQNYINNESGLVRIKGNCHPRKLIPSKSREFIVCTLNQENLQYVLQQEFSFQDQASVTYSHVGFSLSSYILLGFQVGWINQYWALLKRQKLVLGFSLKLYITRLQLVAVGYPQKNKLVAVLFFQYLLNLTKTSLRTYRTRLTETLLYLTLFSLAGYFIRLTFSSLFFVGLGFNYVL